VITTANGNCYLGKLMFEKPSAAKEIFHFLIAHIKKPLRTIGGTDIPLYK